MRQISLGLDDSTIFVVSPGDVKANVIPFG